MGRQNIVASCADRTYKNGTRCTVANLVACTSCCSSQLCNSWVSEPRSEQLYLYCIVYHSSHDRGDQTSRSSRARKPTLETPRARARPPITNRIADRPCDRHRAPQSMHIKQTNARSALRYAALTVTHRPDVTARSHANGSSRTWARLQPARMRTATSACNCPPISADQPRKEEPQRRLGPSSGSTVAAGGGGAHPR